MDANLLLLYLCGRSFRHNLHQLKFLRRYTPEDVDFITRVVEYFPHVVTTPNILTEASNIAGRDLRDDVRATFSIELVRSLEVWSEDYVESHSACADDTFARLGLTDAVITKLAETGVLVLSDDFRLTGVLQTRGLQALNLNDVRGW